MAGTHEGGRKAAETNKRRYGDGTGGTENFYTIIGRKGGKISRGGGFTKHDVAVAAGRKGGQVSKRNKNA